MCRPTLLAALLAVLALAACGGRDEAAERRECEDAFVEGFVASFAETADATVSAPEEAARESARLFCAEAVGVVDPDSDDFEAEAEAIIEDHPEILHPACRGSALAGLEALAPEALAGASEEVEEFAVRFCDLAIAEGLVSLTRSPTDADLDRLVSEHPEVATPLCVAGGMMNYDANPLIIEGVEVAPERAEDYLRRVCEEGIAAGVLSGPGAELTPAQQQQVDDLSARIFEEMIAAGELP